ncbi:MAG: cell surface protein SprA [bacterium]
MLSKRQERKAVAGVLFCCLAFLSSFLPVAPSFGQDSSEEPTIRAEIGLRLPDASRLDPRTFPFENRIQPGLSLNGSEGSWLRWQPVSLQRKIAVDSTGQFITIREDFLGEPLRFPFSVPLEKYYTLRLVHEQNMLWHQMAAQSVYGGSGELRAGRGGVDIDIPVPIKSKAFSQIFGGSSVGLNVQGDIGIEGGFRREDRSEARTVLNQGANTNFKMNQTQRFTVTGRIGEKVTVNVDQDSERPFDFENSIKLNYTGFDDDILKKIEAGNIALSLPGTRFVTFGGTSAGLFGVKSEMQLGNLFITGIASQEKGENKKLTLSGGATEGSQQIHDYQYRRYTYFFIDTDYREKFRDYASKWIHTYNPDRPIKRIEVYKFASETIPGAVAGVAYRIPPPPGSTIPSDATEKEQGFFKKLLLDVDYSLVPNLGYIRMETPVNESEVLALAYEDSNGTIIGDIDYNLGLEESRANPIKLKLIKSRTPLPSRERNATWHLEWKNVYSLGSRNIPQEGFELKIFQKPIGAGDAQETLIQEGKPPRSFLNVFALDEIGTTAGSQPDNHIDNDPAIIDYARGELIFPDPRPFDPDGGPFGSPTQVGETTEPNRLPQDLHVAAVYDTNSVSHVNFSSRFYIAVKSKNRSTNYSLGFNVIEGSEEVRLNGAVLQRDVDYTIDYFSGSLTLLSEQATKPDALVDVSYQSNQLFQLEKKTIMGTRAEYRFGRDSFLGGTFLYQNERSLEQRVRLGGGDRGPMKNLIWDVNTKLEFRPNFLSHMLNALPFLSTQENSVLRLEGEIAQILPNPNTLNSETTGDADGVAYVDDFEGTKRITPLGVNRRGWVLSSIPVEVLRDPGGITLPNDGLRRFEERRALARRGDLLWYNVLIPLKVIYPNRDVNAQVAQTATVMNLEFKPHDNHNDTTTFSPYKSWAGLMRALSPGYFDQTETKFLELWIRGTQGKVHVDLGQISEDVIPDGSLNSEDIIPRNQLLDDGEDNGLDNDNRPDPDDFWRVIDNNPARMIPVWGEPSSIDDYFFVSGTTEFGNPGEPSINGTQGNKNDEGGARPDTEDLNGNGSLDFVGSESYYSYAFNLDPARRKYVEGGSDSTGWYLYRIPLVETAGVTGTPTFSNIEYVRIWVDSVNVGEDPALIQIAEINLVSNEWKELGLAAQDTSLAGLQKDEERFRISVVNTEENPAGVADPCNPGENSYESPPGVLRERDRINQVLAKEQSLVLDVDGLRSNEVAVAQKTFYQPLSFIHYSRLKMFIYGADKASGLIRSDLDTSKIEFFIRFGADDKNYYEFREDVFCGWDSRNEMDIELARITNFKRLRSDYEQVTENGLPVADYYYLRVSGTRQQWRVRGNPSLTNIRTLVAGVRNRSTDPNAVFNGEIWMNELRVSEVQKQKGVAARARADLKLADFGNFNAEIEQLDADFHNVSTRFGTGDNTRRLTLGGSMAVDKLLPQWLGLSVPVSMSYSESKAMPKYFPGSDIFVLTSELDDTTRSYIESYSNQIGFNLTMRRRVKSNNFFIKNTIDNLSAGFSSTFAKASNSTTQISRRTGYAGNVDYTLAFGNNNFIKPFAWIGKAPLFGMLSNTKLYYTPQRIDARMQATSTDTRSQTRTLTAAADSSIPGPLVRPPTDYNVQHSYGTSIKIFDNLTADFSRAYSSKVRPDTVGLDDSEIERVGFVEGLQRFADGYADLLSGTQSFNARYNPALVSWMTNSFTYTSAFRYNNNIQQVDVGRSAGVSSTLGLSTSIRLAQFFQALQNKRKTGPSTGTHRPPGRTAPGEEQPPDKEGEGAAPPRRAPGEKPPEDKETPKSGEKDKEKSQTEEKSQGAGINPINFFIGMFAKLRDIQLSYNQRDNLNHNALASGNVSLRYMFGLESDPGTGTAGNYTGIFRSTTKAKTYSASTGLDLTRNLNLNLKFDYDLQETETTNRTGTTSISYFQLDREGGGIPFPEGTITWSGLEKFPLLKRIASTASASTNISGKKSTAWKDSTSGLIGEDFSINFRPLLRVSINWKNGMVTTAQYNKTSGYKPTYNPIGREDEDGFIDYFQSAAFTRTNDLTFTHTYSKRSGFRIPLPFLRNKELKNSVDLSVNFTRSLTESSAKYSRDSQEVVNNSTQRWEFSPRVTYTFSTRVRGSAHFTYGKTESRLIGNTTIKELGIDVNISIRGQ